MEQNQRTQYACSYISNISWLTADITLLSFAPLGDFLIDLPHTHPFMELHYVQSGKILVQLSDRQFALEKGQLLFLNAHVPHAVTNASDELPVIYNLSFFLRKSEPTEKVPAEWIKDERQLIRPLFKNNYLTAHDSSGCKAEVQQIIRHIDTHRRGDFVRVRSYISNFIMAALQSFTRTTPDPRYSETLNGSNSFSATKILFYIRDHFTEGLTLASVADAVHYSPRQCQRIIQETMGVSFSELLQELQLSYAKTLLVSTNDSLEAISAAAGFNGSRSLYRYFKLQEGISPAQYRKSFAKSPDF